jgi:hypothetical protein
MQRLIALTLCGALLLAPALPVLAAEDKAAAAQPAPAAPAAVAAKDAAPDLPDTKDSGDVKDSPEDVTGTAEPEVPKEALAVPGKVKPDEPEARFKAKNFLLGFLGGAAVGAAAGILFFSRDADNGLDTERAKVVVPVAAGVGGLGFGLVAMLLGATTPEEAKPPKVESLAPAAGVQAGVNVRYDWSF